VHAEASAGRYDNDGNIKDLIDHKKTKKEKKG
jgi:hypothetical protein